MSKNHWDKSFSKSEYIYGKEPNVFLKEMGHIFTPKSNIACLAEGEGRNSVFLAQQGHKVTAYDQSKVGLAKTKQLAEDKGVAVNTVQMDLTTKAVPKEKYDGATLIFGHVPKGNQRFFFNNLFESVKVGGYVLFEVYSTKQIDYKTGGPGNVSSLYEAKDLLALAEQHEVIHFYYGEAERFEGTNHTGLCHVIQCVVKKQ